MKKRVISAIVALIICVPLVLLGGIWFKLGVTLISVLAMKEFLKLSENKKRPIIVDAAFYALVILLTFMSDKRQVYYFIALLIPMLLVLYCNDNTKYNADDAFKLTGMLLLLGTVFHQFIIIRQSSLMVFIYLFLITMLTDTYAHMGGTLIGKHKLVPKISPNKTWEGSIIGGVFGSLIAATFYYIGIDSSVNILGLLIITLFLSCLGQLGDLFFSAVKRNHNIKDFSNIMPGHGGILDRLDSIIFTIIGYILLSGII
ncbi:MAG: phosphatidate cytidylyltransferase [Bacilli bacterium]